MVREIPRRNSVLDLCAGTAMLYGELRALEVEYTALDINPRFVNSLNLNGICAICADARQAEFPTVDVVVMNLSLYYFWPDVELMVNKMIASAREKVVIMESVQNISMARFSLLAHLAKWATAVDYNVPSFHFTPDIFRETMQSIPGLTKLETLNSGRDMLAVFKPGKSLSFPQINKTELPKLKVAILTSKDHLFCNYLLRCLSLDKALRKDEILIAEQKAIVGGKNVWASIIKYIRKAGLRYTMAQIVKQLLFLFWRLFKTLSGDKGSICYPYYKSCSSHWIRITLNNLKSVESQKVLESFKPDLILSLLSREKIPQKILSLPKLGCINIHPALLPAYRGVSPTYWCIADGKEFGGVTLHWIDEDFDTGNIIAQKAVPVAPHKTEHAFYIECVNAGFPLLLEILKSIRSGRRPLGKTQPRDSGFYRSLPTRSAARDFRRRGYAAFSFAEIMRGRFPS